MADSEKELTHAEEDQCLPLPDARRLVDTVYVINAILQTGGNLSRSAEKLGIGRRTLYDLMERYGISCSEGSLTIELTPLLRYAEFQTPSLEDYMVENP